MNRRQRMLDEGRFASARELAETEGVSYSYGGGILRLTLLAPDVVDHILDGHRAPQLARLMQPFPRVGAVARAAFAETASSLPGSDVAAILRRQAQCRHRPAPCVFSSMIPTRVDQPGFPAHRSNMEGDSHDRA